MTETIAECDWIAFGKHLRINLPNAASACEMVDSRLAHGGGFSIATLNLDHAVLLSKPGAFRDAYAGHSHVTADGYPIAWLARRKNSEVQRVTGSDMIMPFAGIAARLGVPVALIGSTPDVLSAAAEAMAREYPNIDVELKISPSHPFDPEGMEADAVIASVRNSKARMCFLALGAPRQEILAARLAAAVPDVGVISVGAGIDFLAGTARRAPVFFQRIGLEWLWRFMHEPARLGPRYWRCIKLLPALVSESNGQHSPP